MALHSPDPSLNIRVSRFAEDMPHDYPHPYQHQSGSLYAHRTSSDPALSRPSIHITASHDDTYLSTPPLRPHHSRSISTPHSDSERLLAGSRSHEAPLYIESKRDTVAPELRNSRGFYVTRIVLRVVVVLLSIAIVGVLAAAVKGYQDTKDVREPFRDGSGDFTVWPAGLKLWPAKFLFGVALVAMWLGTLLLLGSFYKTLRRMTKVGNITTVIVSSVCLVLWIAVTAYYASWDTKETNWDLLSWSCTHSAEQYHYANIDFGKTCIKMRFTIWAAVALAVLEGINLLLFVVWLVKAKKGGNIMEGAGTVLKTGLGGLLV